MIFRLQKMDTISEEEREHQEQNEDKEAEERKLFYVTMTWEGCNPNAEIKANEQSEGYYTFGEKGFENNNYQSNWDGTYRGNRLADGVYFYVVKAKSIYNDERDFHGSVTILR